MSVLIVVPVRYASVRYPGKPLVELTGATGQKKTLTHRSWEAACKVIGVDRVVVATDDDRIADAAAGIGADVVMTPSSCANGTERCAAAHDALGGDYDIVVNLQGDAPLTPPWFIEDLVAGLKADPEAGMATPVLRCDGKTLRQFLSDRRAGRVGGTTAVFDKYNRALFFSKEVIPYCSETYDPTDPTPVFHHVGVYAYRPRVLAAYRNWQVGPLEKQEGLEQLRFMENGHVIRCVEVTTMGRQFWELNNPEDVPKLEQMMLEMGIK